jgi:DNA-binding response OmpR family regulator
MAQRSPPRRPRALIVEDEIMVALDLEETMIDLGFDSCGLAPSDRSARSLAMTDQPDVVLMDVCLNGGREGIETARWLREVCGASVVFVNRTLRGAQKRQERPEEEGQLAFAGVCILQRLACDS